MNQFRLRIACALLLITLSAHAESRPRGSAVDSRVKILVYSPSEVYKLVAYYGFQIDIQIGDAEEIKTIAAGDSVAWQIVASGQHIFIKPMASQARTNLSIITNKRTYVFDLSTRSAETREDIAYLVRFRYPESEALASIVRSAAGRDGSSFNLDYKVTGSVSVRPTHVFDDGQFTYFEFDPARELPAIFVVGANGKESLINYRMENRYVVVERLGDFFTMRNGKETATVINQRQLNSSRQSFKESYHGTSDSGK